MSLQTWWHFRRVWFFLSLNRREHAMNALRDVLAIEPSNMHALSSLGFLHGDAGDHAQAERYFREALAAAPGDANTLFNLGYILQKQSRHEEAIAAFESAVSINATLDRAWFGKGMSLVALKRHADAIPAFERAAKLQPMNPHALYELGMQHHVLGQRDALDKVIEKLRGFDPKATAQLIAATRTPETTRN